MDEDIVPSAVLQKHEQLRVYYYESMAWNVV